MSLRLIDDIDGSLLKLWRFWSVRFGILAGACSAAVASYEGFKALDPMLVRHVPEWIVGMLAAGAVGFTFASVVSRGIDQPKLRQPPADDDDNAEHA